MRYQLLESILCAICLVFMVTSLGTQKTTEIVQETSLNEDLQDKGSNIQMGHKYRLECNAFILEINFSVSEKQMEVELIDIISGQKYQRLFTEQDIGNGQIHKKQDLLDIYETILSEEHLKMIASGQKKSSTDYLNFHYQLGNQINRGNRSFKVLNKGIIQTKRKAPSRILSNLEPEYYSSRLILKQKGALDSSIVFDIKLSQFKRGIQYEINNLKKQIQFIKYGTSKMENSSQIQCAKGICNIQQDKTDIKEDLFTILKRQNQVLKQQLTVLSRANPLAIDFSSPFISKFAFDNNTVTYTGQANTWTQIFQAKPLSQAQVTTFTVRIRQTSASHLMIGIFNHKVHFKQRSSHGGNAYCYYGYDGTKYSSGGKDGKGYRKGDILRVTVDPFKRLIKWAINFEYTATMAIKGNALLSDFSPYFQFYNKGDSIVFINEEELS